MDGADEESTDEVLARAVDALYAVDPSEFVSARTARVRQLRADGLREVAKQVGALRRPSVAAAAVNATVRADDPVVARLEDLGSRMRHAQSSLDAAALSALRGERDEVLAAWVAAAREHAGGLTAAVEGEVRDTAVAALADAAASEVVTSGSLTRALSYSGFGEVDVADAVARTSTGVVLTRIEGGKGSTDEADEEPDEEPDEDEEPEPDEDEEPDGEPDEDEGPEPEDEDDEDEPTTRPATRSVRSSDVSALEMELDAAEKVVAAARAARKQAAADDAAAQQALAGAASRVEQAEQALRTAQEEAEAAASTAKESAEALESAEDELRRSRRERDAARAALEEAEDR